MHRGWLWALLVALMVSCAAEEEVRQTPDSSASTAPPQSDELIRKQLEKIQALLTEEVEARIALEQRVEDLSEMLGLPQEARPFEAVDELQGRSAVEDEQEEAIASDGESPEEAVSELAEKPVFDVNALVLKGLPPYEAERLRERWEQYALDKIYLDDQASREGWRRKPQHYYQRQQLQRDIREELGDEGWDQMLYASGQNNRVVIRDVLGGSAAEIAGLQPGDTILRYDDNPMYKVPSLQRATTRGEIGERVQVEILRAGERFTTDVERGPLGTMLRASRDFPDAN